MKDLKSWQVLHNGKKYRFNLEKFFDFLEKYEQKLSNTTEILNNYEVSDMSRGAELTAKAVRDYKTQGMAKVDSMYYDIMSMMFAKLIGVEAGGGDGEKLCWNTFIHYGFLEEI